MRARMPGRGDHSRQRDGGGAVARAQSRVRVSLAEHHPEEAPARGRGGMERGRRQIREILQPKARRLIGRPVPSPTARPPCRAGMADVLVRPGMLWYILVWHYRRFPLGSALFVEVVNGDLAVGGRGTRRIK